MWPVWKETTSMVASDSFSEEFISNLNPINTIGHDNSEVLSPSLTERFRIQSGFWLEYFGYTICYYFIVIKYFQSFIQDSYYRNVIYSYDDLEISSFLFDSNEITARKSFTYKIMTGV